MAKYIQKINPKREMSGTSAALQGLNELRPGNDRTALLSASMRRVCGGPHETRWVERGPIFCFPLARPRGALSQILAHDRSGRAQTTSSRSCRSCAAMAAPAASAAAAAPAASKHSFAADDQPHRPPSTVRSCLTRARLIDAHEVISGNFAGSVS